jgi:hypothetical protein
MRRDVTYESQLVLVYSTFSQINSVYTNYYPINLHALQPFLVRYKLFPGDLVPVPQPMHH